MNLPSVFFLQKTPEKSSAGSHQDAQHFHVIGLRDLVQKGCLGPRCLDVFGRPFLGLGMAGVDVFHSTEETCLLTSPIFCIKETTAVFAVCVNLHVTILVIFDFQYFECSILVQMTIAFV